MGFLTFRRPGKPSFLWAMLVGTLVLTLVAIVRPTAAKDPKSDQDNRRQNPPAGRSEPSRKQTPPAGRSGGGSGRVQRETPPSQRAGETVRRGGRNDTPAPSRRSGEATRRGERGDTSPSSRSGEATRRSDRGGASKQPRSGSSSQQPETRKPSNTRGSDTAPKGTRRSEGKADNERRNPPGDRSRIDDVRRRLGGKDRDNGQPPAKGSTKPTKPTEARPTQPGGKPGVGPSGKPSQPGNRPGQHGVKPGQPGAAGGPKGGPPRDPHDVRFADRMKSGDIDRLTRTKTAKQLQLAEQYRMYRQGDVARRMQLEKHGRPMTFYRGPIAPGYDRHCFKYRYWGPTFFANVVLYPTWSPWVSWSWGYHCHPYWDPRPVWCRPVFYDPCPAWVYWHPPVWVSLPHVTCGTWVDVKPVVVPSQQSDLQLLAVRFVDPGHPEEKTGPRYRVWFRNNGARPVTQPFDVMLFASLDDRLVGGLPQAGVRVTAVEAGDVQSVDVRLPAAVYAMGRDAQGNSVPFGTLHVLVDANQEVADLNRANNGARMTPGEILPVDPATFEADPVSARTGGEVLLAGEGFGPQPGRVLVQVNGKEVDADILGWYDLGIRLAIPKGATAAPAQADLVVIRGDGAAANPIRITITP